MCDIMLTSQISTQGLIYRKKVLCCLIVIVTMCVCSINVASCEIQIMNWDDRGVYSCLYVITQLADGMRFQEMVDIVNGQEVVFHDYAWLNKSSILFEFTDHINLEITGDPIDEVCIGFTGVTTNGIDPLLSIRLPEKPETREYCRVQAIKPSKNTTSLKTAHFDSKVRMTEFAFGELYYACTYLSKGINPSEYLNRLDQYNVRYKSVEQKENIMTIVFSPRYSMKLYLAEGLINEAEIIGCYQELDGQELHVGISTEMTYHDLYLRPLGD